MIEHSVAVIRHVETLRLPASVLDQITRAVTSIGANYAEAQDASSKRDFANKIYIAKKEAGETLYWLQFIAKYAGSSPELTKYADSTQRFIMTLQKIVTSLKSQPIQGNS